MIKLRRASTENTSQKKLELISVKELVKRIDFSESWVRKQVFKKKIPFMKIQGSIKFDWLRICQWIKEKEVGINVYNS